MHKFQDTSPVAVCLLPPAASLAVTLPDNLVLQNMILNILTASKGMSLTEMGVKTSCVSIFFISLSIASLSLWLSALRRALATDISLLKLIGMCSSVAVSLWTARAIGLLSVPKADSKLFRQFVVSIDMRQVGCEALVMDLVTGLFGAGGGLCG